MIDYFTLFIFFLTILLYLICNLLQGWYFEGLDFFVKKTEAHSPSIRYFDKIYRKYFTFFILNLTLLFLIYTIIFSLKIPISNPLIKMGVLTLLFFKANIDLIIILVWIFLIIYPSIFIIRYFAKFPTWKYEALKKGSQGISIKYESQNVRLPDISTKTKLNYTKIGIQRIP